MFNSLESGPSSHPYLLESARPSTFTLAGHKCIGDSCDVLMLSGRICSACLAEAAASCAQQFEAQLIERGLELRTDELRSSLLGMATCTPLNWYQRNSPLGQLTFAEAMQLRDRTDAACLLVAMGGVTALRNLPGLERNFVGAATRGVLDFAALPGREPGRPDREFAITRQDVCQMIAAIFVALLVVAPLVCR